jgi:hypothetical protein
MGISLILMASGLLLGITGVVLLVMRRHRKIAVACLTVGTLLIIVPPILVMTNTM